MKLLENVRVLDLTNVLSGPFATMHLALLGAEVIKIENPDGGDLARKLGNVNPLNKQLMGTSFLAQNSNKKSLTLNLKFPEGKEIFRKLLETADVVVENFRPGVMAKLGFSYEQICQINPRVIYCAISGFGQTGPDAFKPAYDQIIQGLSGVMAVNGDERLNPLRAGFPVCDTVGGLNAAFAIMAALFHRERSGEGQYIDMALLDVQVACLANQAGNYLATGQSPKRLGNAHPNIVPYQDFPTADGYMILAIGNDGQFARFCAAAGAPQLATDERFATNRARVVNRATLIPLLKKLTVERGTAEWIATLEALAVPCGPINTLADVFADPQVQARGLKVTMPHPVAGQVPLVASPMKLSATPVDYRLPPPMLGEHTDEILAATLGLDAAAIARLRADGVV